MMWCAAASAAVIALLAAMVVPAVRRHLREDADEAGGTLAALTGDQRAEYERLTAENRRRQAEEDAERARAEALMREQDEQEGR